MALTDAQKIRLGIAINHMRREPSWQTIRQFCLAESAAEAPEYQELKEFILGVVASAVDDEIQNGINARK